MSVFCFYTLFLFVRHVLADLEVYHNDPDFEAGNYGPYPVQTYNSTDIVSPHMNVLQWSSECDDGLYTFLTPRGGATHEASAMILDNNGNLVWKLEGYNQIYNLLVQEYKGEQYLTFWAGNDAVGGHGAGFYYMLDTSYTQVMKIGAAGGLDGDLHEFRITEQGTALFTVYEIVQVDLSTLGKSSFGPIWDCLVQEIDIVTGELLFQWRAADHFAISDTYKEIGDHGEPGRDFDWFHMNSIDKDPKGNYLVSSRYLHAITYINGTTGDIIWVLGGKKNMFEDMSNGHATDFAYQHDARWSDNYTTITLFNNAVDDEHPRIAVTRGLRIKIDQEHMTAELVADYVNPHKIRGISQGSFQTLPNDNAFMGYGNTAAFTEYSHNGTVLCDTHYGPESAFGAGQVQSYRIYKYEWHGWPTSDPDVALVRDGFERWNIFVSWNGATEVTEWILQGSENPNVNDEDWNDLARLERLAFETRFDLGGSYQRYMRVLGLDSSGRVLGVSEVLDITQEDAWSLAPLRIQQSETGWLNILIGLCGLTGLGVGFREALASWRSRRKPIRLGTGQA
ncbi:hypothetical protein IFR04_015344 [Cadophora malorum]|uniref:Arylsulfotransferase n=1 Tax=Cadophora malorum TaxID=108018 RepID=A0A8H7VYK6_9HELO|nr:hypothetical protein IFR04_015344 [Cadophora malorum]